MLESDYERPIGPVDFWLADLGNIQIAQLRFPNRDDMIDFVEAASIPM